MCWRCGRSTTEQVAEPWGRSRCRDEAACRAFVEAKRDKARLRVSVPPDAVVPELHGPQGGVCKWCGEPIYRRNKAGLVVVSKQRMWHDGREVDPRAHPEPNCLAAYYREFPQDFRQAVFIRDQGICACCGRDIPAEADAMRRARRAAWDAHYEKWMDSAYPHPDAYWEEYRAIQDGFREPCWHADHVKPLEDGGEHLMANAQTLCEGCHVVKTAEENRERAVRRRGQLAMGAL